MSDEREMLANLKIAMFADGADPIRITELARGTWACGFTTNPTLMSEAGFRSYRALGRRLVRDIGGMPISFEVIADDGPRIEAEAYEIASWGENVYVKVPITNTRGVSLLDVVRKLARDSVKLNVTAISTIDQARRALDALEARQSFISILAGRIADTGRDPVPTVEQAVSIALTAPDIRVIWASTREVLNIYQAEAVGCHIITIGEAVAKKLSGIGKDLNEVSLHTIRQFSRDAVAAGIKSPLAD